MSVPDYLHHHNMVYHIITICQALIAAVIIMDGIALHPGQQTLIGYCNSKYGAMDEHIIVGTGKGFRLAPFSLHCRRYCNIFRYVPFPPRCPFSAVKSLCRQQRSVTAAFIVVAQTRFHYGYSHLYSVGACHRVYSHFHVSKQPIVPYFVATT